MEKKLRVLMLGPDRGVHGGISAVVNELYSAGLDKKVHLQYIGTMKEGSKMKKLFVAAFAYVRFLFSVGAADVVHVNFSSDSSFLRKSVFIKTAHAFGKKIVLHQHGGDFKTFYGKELSEKGRENVRRTLEMGDVMLVLTKSWKEFFSGITSGDKIRVFPNGIRTQGVEETIASKDYDKILFLGRICKDKGIDELLEAVGNLHKKRDSVKLYLGGIYEESGYKAKVQECSAFTEYLGWVSGSDKDRYLNECGILVLPSYYEGFPVSIIEGMFRRSAVVASCVGGIPDIIDNRENGILIQPKDAKSLENALRELIDNREFAAKLGEAGRKKVIENYSVENNVEELLRIYNA